MENPNSVIMERWQNLWCGGSDTLVSVAGGSRHNLLEFSSDALAFVFCDVGTMYANLKKNFPSTKKCINIYLISKFSFYSCLFLFLLVILRFHFVSYFFIFCFCCCCCFFTLRIYWLCAISFCQWRCYCWCFLSFYERHRNAISVVSRVDSRTNLKGAFYAYVFFCTFICYEPVVGRWQTPKTGGEIVQHSIQTIIFNLK